MFHTERRTGEVRRVKYAEAEPVGGEIAIGTRLDGEIERGIGRGNRRGIGERGTVGIAHRRGVGHGDADRVLRSEEHTSELQSLMRSSYAVFCLKKKKTSTTHPHTKEEMIFYTQSTKHNRTQ